MEKQAQALKQQKEGFRFLVRIANTDLDGSKCIGYAMRKIKGVGIVFAHMACSLCGIDIRKKAGELSKEETEKLDGFIKDPMKFGAPAWALNRRKDPETGEDMHLVTGNLAFVKDNDIKKLKKIKSYRGSRHIKGLPCRGQRTKSNFRKSKSRGKGGLGVVKKRVGKTGGK